MYSQFLFRCAGTLALAWLAAAVCVWLRTPIPWMIGPLLAVSLASILGAPTHSWAPLRNAAQWTIGTALGLYFTAEVVALVTGLWWAIALAVVWALGLGVLFGRWLHRVNARHFPGVPDDTLRATTYFAGAIGGASEMTLLAERVHARTDLVAASHSMRLVIVTLAIPFGMQFSGLQGLDMLAPATRVVNAGGLALLAVLTGIGALLMRRLGRANPWFMGALLVAMGLTMAGVSL